MHAAMRGHGIASTSGRDASVRAVEADSRLVAAPRGADFAVLQLPRGNLETVSPRALVLAALVQALLVSRSFSPCCWLCITTLPCNMDFVAVAGLPVPEGDAVYTLKPNSIFLQTLSPEGCVHVQLSTGNSK